MAKVFTLSAVIPDFDDASQGLFALKVGDEKAHERRTVVLLQRTLVRRRGSSFETTRSGECVFCQFLGPALLVAFPVFLDVFVSIWSASI